MRNALGACLLLLAPSAFAQKISVLNFTGPDAVVVRVQIAQSLCESKTCVDPKKVSKGSKPDWAKARKQQVGIIITGAIKKKGGKKSLDLQVHTKPGKPQLKKVITFSGGELNEKALGKALQALNKAIGGAEQAEEPSGEDAEEEPKKTEPEAEKTEPPEKPKEAESEEKPEEPKRGRHKKDTEPPPPPKEDERTGEEKPGDEKEKEKPAEEESSSDDPFKTPIVELEAGADLFGRNFSYNMVGTMNLRSYSAPFIFAPDLRVEFYPLAFVTKGLAAGLGLDGSFATAIGLKSRRSGTDTTWPTTLTHYDFDVRFRVKPVPAVDAAVIPFVGYGNRHFAVGTGTDGSALDGLPSVSYSSVRIGVAGELPFSTSGFMVFAKFAALVVLSSGQIISPDFFSKGSNFGIEGQAGVGYRVFGPLQLRLAFDFTRYGLTFKTTASDQFVAAGAVDMYVGGNFGVRLVF
jgi:hypothetical protein